VFNEPAVPTTGIAGKNSYSRGAAVEAGIGAKFPANVDPNQIILPKITEAAAAPSTTLKRDDLIAPVNADPLLYLSAATNKAQSLWNNDFCPIGQPISYGENDLADAQLLNASSTNKFPNGQPVLSETPTGDYTTTNFNQSYTYLFPTGKSTFGIGAVNRQVFAPITILKGQVSGADLAVLTLLGTWQLRVESTGNAAPTVTYAAYDNLGNKLTGATPVATLTIAGMATPLEITAQQVFGAGGLDLNIPPTPQGPYLVQLHIGTPPTAIPGRTNGFTTDAVLVNALNVPSQINVANVSYGHMEAQAVAPAGGISCTIPTSKVFTDANGAPVGTLQGGNNFTWKVTFPTVDISKELACDLTSITVTDTATATGAASATITGSTPATNPPTKGSVSAGHPFTAVYPMPNYHPGDPPEVLTITGTLGSGAGTITNSVVVDAHLSNCTGGALGKAFVTNGSIGGSAATIQGTAVLGNATTGAVNITAAAVLPARLAETGQKDPWLPVLGGGLLLGALGLMRSRRRLHTHEVIQEP
jgi:LPXTG-motif cell wall-anchored protein